MNTENFSIKFIQNKNSIYISNLFKINLCIEC